MAIWHERSEETERCKYKYNGGQLLDKLLNPDAPSMAVDTAQDN